MCEFDVSRYGLPDAIAIIDSERSFCGFMRKCVQRSLRNMPFLRSIDSSRWRTLRRMPAAQNDDVVV